MEESIFSKLLFWRPVGTWNKIAFKLDIFWWLVCSSRSSTQSVLDTEMNFLEKESTIRCLKILRPDCIWCSLPATNYGWEPQSPAQKLKTSFGRTFRKFRSTMIKIHHLRCFYIILIPQLPTSESKIARDLIGNKKLTSKVELPDKLELNLDCCLTFYSLFVSVINLCTRI